MVAYTGYRDTRIRKEARALVERGDVVDFICMGGEKNQVPEFDDGIRIIKLTCRRYKGSSTIMYLMSYMHFFFVSLFNLGRLHLEDSYQIIQVHTMPDFMVFVSIIPKLMGAKVILDVHDLMPELYQSKFGYTENHLLIRFITWIERLSIGFADRAIAVSKPHLDVLLQHGNPAEKFSILLNVPDARYFFPASEKKLENTPGLELVYHGTIAMRYGLDTAIMAVAALRGTLHGLKLTIIGNGEDIKRLFDLVAELGLQESVSIKKGWFLQADLVPLIRKGDVGIVPILDDEFTKHTLPTKLLEYVSLGMPVICSRIETVEKYFDDSMVQYFSAGSVTDLAEKITYLYQNPDRRAELVTNANEFNLIYNWENQKKSYYQLIDGLVMS